LVSTHRARPAERQLVVEDVTAVLGSRSAVREPAPSSDWMTRLEVRKARALAIGSLWARYYLRLEAAHQSRVEPRSLGLSVAEHWPVR
jgi:hypothetical protein